jgi:hypothetical protein
MTAQGWRVAFLEADLKTSLSRAITFQDPAKVDRNALRGGAGLTPADRQALEHGIEMGWIRLAQPKQ